MLDSLKQQILHTLEEACGFPAERARELLAEPPKPELGDFSLPCFVLAKERKQAPPAIAAELAPLFNQAARGITAEAAGPYLNFRLDKQAVINLVLRTILGQDALLPAPGAGQTVVIDFSSPNIAKPFSMGHLRATTIGNALAHIHRALGWEVVRINHLGDWGTQFGKLITAYRMWGDDQELEAREIDYLMEIYVRFNDQAKQQPDLDDQARAAFKELEDGNQEAHALWQKFRDISLREFERLYRDLNVEFDSCAGESFYNDKIPAVLDKLEAAGLLKESEGARVVDLGEKMPPCMLIKSDGATTYAARDLAALFYRHETYGFDRLLYVVGAPQALHFRQVFAVLHKLGLAYADKCLHVPFGQVLKEGELMSTRRGNVVFLEDVIEKAGQLALEKILEDSELEADQVDDELRERARTIAISSIIFFDLKNGRIKDVDFNWEEILNPKGETGIYLQYAHARIHGIMDKFKAGTGLSIADIRRDCPVASEDAAYPIIQELARFPEKVAYAAESQEPSVISRYLLDLASAFSTYYRANRVINPEDTALSAQRMAVVLAVREVLGQGLQLLGIQPLEKM